VRSRGRCRYFRGILCVLALLCSAVSFSAADDSKHLTSILIVARSELPDPFFSASVVLVMNNLAPGPVGIIVNRPTEVPVSRLLPEIKSLQGLRDKVYFGGPVEPDVVWFLIRAASPPEHAVKVCEGVYLSGDRNVLLKLLNRGKPMEGLKVFAGHAGWAPGQLEVEIDNGDWASLSANSDGIFKRRDELPWPSPKHPPEDSI
jgi:putative transcriptional regulator